MDVSGVVVEGIGSVELPKMGKIRQICDDEKIENAAKKTREELEKLEVLKNLSENDEVAIGVGSRGIDRLDVVVKEVVKYIKQTGANPFIVPAMASHGGASAEGQKKVLAGYGITEEEVGVPVKSSMEAVKLGTTQDGTPIYFDKTAYQADAVIPINRVKVHTDFSAEVESGLMKMLSIGFGKHKGATAIHKQGFENFARIIPEAGRFIIKKAPVLAGIALVENAWDKLYKIEAVESNQIEETDKRLLKLQKELMPQIPFKKVDVLIIDEMGKDISGSGMDTNVVGRVKEVYPDIDLIFIRDLTKATHGNATGIGLADLTTKKLFEKIDFNATYTNLLTARVIENAKLPMVLPDDNMAIKTAQLLSDKNKSTINMVRIKNTLEIMEMEVSENLFELAKGREGIEIAGKLKEFVFSSEGELK